MENKTRPEQIIMLINDLISNDSFIKSLIQEGIIDFKSANTRKSFGIKELDQPILTSGKTFRDWIDENRLPNSMGYEKALIWCDHNSALTTGSLRFTGRLLNQYSDNPFLEVGNQNHHRTQHCSVIFWSKLQLMSDTEIKEVILAWLTYLKAYFGLL